MSIWGTPVGTHLPLHCFCPLFYCHCKLSLLPMCMSLANKLLEIWQIRELVKTGAASKFVDYVLKKKKIAMRENGSDGGIKMASSGI